MKQKSHLPYQHSKVRHYYIGSKVQANTQHRIPTPCSVCHRRGCARAIERQRDSVLGFLLVSVGCYKQRYAGSRNDNASSGEGCSIHGLSFFPFTFPVAAYNSNAHQCGTSAYAQHAICRGLIAPVPSPIFGLFVFFPHRLLLVHVAIGQHYRLCCGGR